MGKKEFLETTINPSSPTHLTEMWVGPRNREEIEKALTGHPTIVAVPNGPNLNDGSGADYYRRKKGFRSMDGYDSWLKDQTPSKPILACPYCDEFTADSKTALQAHIKECSGVTKTADKVAAKTYHCTVEKCKASFESQKQLSGHMAGAHKGIGKSKADMRQEDE